MAASGFTPISLYYSTTASAVPTSGNLANGELGLNIADMKLYAKNSAGTVTLLASSSSTGATVSSVSGTGTVNGLTLTGTVTTSGSLTLGGTLSGTASININGTVGATTATTGAFTTVTATSDVRASGTSATNYTNTLVMDQASANSSRLLAFGSDGTTQGSLSILNIANDGSPATTHTFSSTGLAVTGSISSTTGANFATTSGNVGIGTASPTFKLQNTGDSQLIASGGASIVGNIDKPNYAITDTAGTLKINWFGGITFATSGGTQRFFIGTAGQFGIGATPSYGTSGQVLTSGGASAAPTWTTPSTASGTVTSVTVAAGTGMSGGGTVTTSGTITLTNAGVTSIVAGTGITISGSTGAVTVNASGGSSYTAKTANYTAVSGDSILADTSSGSFTITLPASPSTGNVINFVDSKGTFQRNPLTVARNGQNIMGVAEDLIAGTATAGFGLVYNGTEWRII